MKIYNTLTNRKDEFVALEPGTVSMYACGITPYRPSHLGHAMQAVIFDVIRRYLEYRGYAVTYVRNYTDIDDKIIQAAQELGIPPLQHSEAVIRRCDAGLSVLGVRPADREPKVSETIPEILAMIQSLIDGGFAYATDKGNVYFAVRSRDDYGKLSRQDIHALRQGVRKQVDEDKRDAADFSLWKAARDEGFSWQSPWGRGRPGWHIECSAMSRKFLGPRFDIHGGGRDLVFPHHENEIAQSESASGGAFAAYWIHNGLLMVGKEKMSKSLRNDVAIERWLERYHPQVIRYLIVTNHYRSHVQFAEDRYAAANRKIYQAYQTLLRADAALNGTETTDPARWTALIQEFERSMDNDFNTVPVVAQLHRALQAVNELTMEQPVRRDALRTQVAFIRKVGGVLGILDAVPADVIREIRERELKHRKLEESDIRLLVNQRVACKQAGDIAAADAIRRQLTGMGILVNDGRSGTTWDFDL